MAAETNPPSADAAGASPAMMDAGAGQTAPSEFDPLAWELPVLCKDCEQPFRVPYRHFQTGVVFHCPHCHGSFVPKLPMYRAARETFESFYGERRRAQEEFARKAGDASEFQRRQAQELEQFKQKLDQLAQAMRPAGKMIKRKGLAAMFT